MSIHGMVPDFGGITYMLQIFLLSRSKSVTCIRRIKYSFRELIILTLEGTIPSGRFTVWKTILAPSD